MITLVKRQEARCRSGKLRGHVDLTIAHRKMDDSAAGEVQQWLGGLPFRAGVTVEAVLVDGVLDALRELGLQFGCGDRNPLRNSTRSMQFSFAEEYRTCRTMRSRLAA